MASSWAPSPRMTVISKNDSNVIPPLAICQHAKPKGTTRRQDNAVINITGKGHQDMNNKQPTPKKAPAAGPSKSPPNKPAGPTKSSTSSSGVTGKRPSDRAKAEDIDSAEEFSH